MQKKVLPDILRNIPRRRNPAVLPLLLRPALTGRTSLSAITAIRSSCLLLFGWEPQPVYPGDIRRHSLAITGEPIAACISTANAYSRCAAQKPSSANLPPSLSASPLSCKTNSCGHKTTAWEFSVRFQMTYSLRHCFFYLRYVRNPNTRDDRLSRGINKFSILKLFPDS